MMQHDWYQAQRTGVVFERLAQRITAKEAAAYLSRIDKNERDGIEEDVTEDILDVMHERMTMALGDET